MPNNSQVHVVPPTPIIQEPSFERLSDHGEKGGSAQFGGSPLTELRELSEPSDSASQIDQSFN